jgi:hypothetical protein
MKNTKLSLLVFLCFVSSVCFAGDVSSSGDGPLKKQDLINYWEQFLQKKPLLACTLNNRPLLVEVSESFNNIANSGGAIRVQLPGKSGGGKAIFIDAYKQYPFISPATGEYKYTFYSNYNIKGGQSYINLAINVKPVESKMEITSAVLTLRTPEIEVTADSRDNEISCAWGALKPGWD